jgi:hypothetical protein
MRAVRKALQCSLCRRDSSLCVKDCDRALHHRLLYSSAVMSRVRMSSYWPAKTT